MHVNVLLYIDFSSLFLLLHFLSRCYVFRYEFRSKYFYVCYLHSHIHIYIYTHTHNIYVYIYTWVHKYPSHTACWYTFLPRLALHLVPSSLWLLFVSVCRHYAWMTREEVANLLITGDAKGTEGVLFAFKPLPFTSSTYLQFLFLLWCAPSASFSYCFFFSVSLFYSILCHPHRGGS
jgi:hypothetical protein